MKLDIFGKHYSKYVDIIKHSDKKPDKYDRKPFTKEQLNILWDLKDDKYYQIILILIYTGLRIEELLFLKKENVYLEEHYLQVTKSKTENGIRKVPISDYIYPFVKDWYYRSKCDYLLHTEEQNIESTMIVTLFH